MKRYRILVISFFCFSCSKLDVNPTTQYSANTFWADEEQFNAGLIGVYNTLYNAEILFNGEMEMLTPNAISYDARNGTAAVAKGEALSTNELFSSVWTSAYRGIGRANTLLDRIDGATFSQTTKDQMKGQALFLRALYYSYLTDYYGDCPLVLTTPNANEHGSLPRSPKEQVVNQIVADLTQAAGLLPDSYAAAQTGRATKGASLALMARVLLYNQRWQEAADAARQVIDMKKYALFNNYRNFYLLANENNAEVIFDIQYKLPYFKNRYDFVNYTLKRPSPLKSLVDAYLMTDGKPAAESPLYDAATPYENRDPRLLQTIVIPGYMFNGKTVKASDLPVSGFGQKKLTAYADTTTQNIADNNSELNFIVLRYAEVLLTYAEALNEAGTTPGAEIYQALNQIRQRPTVNMPVIATGLSKDQMRAVIRHERRIELAGEGQYYSDIRRWKTIETLNNGPVYNSAGVAIETRQFNADRDYLWAVPQVQRQENPKLTQNPNW